VEADRGHREEVDGGALSDVDAELEPAALREWRFSFLRL